VAKLREGATGSHFDVPFLAIFIVIFFVFARRNFEVGLGDEINS
jgi:hypothetical protein